MLGNEYTKTYIKNRIESASPEYEYYSDLPLEGIVRELSDFSFLPKESFREYFYNSPFKSLQKLTDKINDMIGKVSNEETLQTLCNDPLSKDYVKKLSNNTVKSWFNSENNSGKKRNPSSRADLFKLGFALELDKCKFQEFCQKVFRQKHCVNNPVEYCMIYCLENGRSYADALGLYVQAKEKAKEQSDQADSKDEKADAVESCTTVIVLNEMQKKDDDDYFIEYLSENMSSMKPSLNRINDRFNEIVKKCFSSEESMWTLYKTVIENEFAVLTGEHKQMPGDLSPKAFESYFVPKTDVLEKNGNEKYKNLYRQLAFPGRDDKNKGENKKGKKIKDTKITHEDYQKARKRLIAAHFIWYYVTLFYKNGNEIVQRNEEQNSADYYGDYHQGIDSILEKLNLSPMYFLDPFDRLFLICAAKEDPIIAYYETLKGIYDKT